MDNNHEFGEWVATCAQRGYSVDRRGEPGRPVLLIREGVIPMREDARLICAAPDLLAALLRAQNILVAHCIELDCDGAIEQIDAAIAKATQL